MYNYILYTSCSATNNILYLYALVIKLIQYFPSRLSQRGVSRQISSRLGVLGAQQDRARTREHPDFVRQTAKGSRLRVQSVHGSGQGSGRSETEQARNTERTQGIEVKMHIFLFKVFSKFY